MSDEIDHEFTDEIVCPYCGYKSKYSADLTSDGDISGTTECDRCEKSFEWDANFSVTYTTAKIQEDEE